MFRRESDPVRRAATGRSAEGAVHLRRGRVEAGALRVPPSEAMLAPSSKHMTSKIYDVILEGGVVSVGVSSRPGCECLGLVDIPPDMMSANSKKRPLSSE